MREFGYSGKYSQQNDDIPKFVGKNRAKNTDNRMTQLATGASALIRDEEWLIRRVGLSAHDKWLPCFEDISDLVRG